MLIKLFKHEWKATWKLPTGLIVFLQIVTIFAGLTFAAPFWESELDGLEVLLALVWLLYYFSIIGVSLGITIYLAVRFYKSMYTDEGYLTHTLPVTSHQLLISKVLPMIIWTALGLLGIFVSVSIFATMAVNFLQADMPMVEIITEVVQFFADDEGVRLLVSMLFLGIAGLLSSAMMIAGSITIGQLVGKHKILGSIGAYFAISTVVQICSNIVMIPLFVKDDIYYENSVFDIMTPAYFAIGVIALIIAVVLYFISEFIIRRKLNLD